MRRRVNLLVLAATSLVVVAFVVPLGLLVRRQADQRVRIEAERVVQSLAAVVVRSAALQGGEVTHDALASDLGPLPEGSGVVLPDGSRLGAADPIPGLVGTAVAERAARAAYGEVGWGLAVPVITRSGVVVVHAFVPSEELRRGVGAAWALLTLLAVGLVAASLLVADRLGRTVVRPARSLAEAADRLGGGDLSTRVEVGGPPEMEAIAAAFNVLAARIRDLLAAEREMVADLSHRLRTPLTALRLQAEQVDDPEHRDSLLAQVDRLHQEVDLVIAEARSRPDGRPSGSDLVRVVADRAQFWQVLADEQRREMRVLLPDRPAPVPVPEAEVAAAVDALVANVLTHTPAHASLRIQVDVEGGEARLEVSDAGPGFPAGTAVHERGRSGSGSTGLGLDIARRLAERTGGGMHLGAAPEGGAQVVLRLRLGPPGP